MQFFTSSRMIDFLSVLLRRLPGSAILKARAHLLVTVWKCIVGFVDKLLLLNVTVVRDLGALM